MGLAPIPVLGEDLPRPPSNPHTLASPTIQLSPDTASLETAADPPG